MTVRTQLKSYLDFFESRYGPYPGNSTGVVVDIVPNSINYALERAGRGQARPSVEPARTHDQGQGEGG